MNASSQTKLNQSEWATRAAPIAIRTEVRTLALKFPERQPKLTFLCTQVASRCDPQRDAVEHARRLVGRERVSAGRRAGGPGAVERGAGRVHRRDRRRD